MFLKNCDSLWTKDCSQCAEFRKKITHISTFIENLKKKRIPPSLYGFLGLKHTVKDIAQLRKLVSLNRAHHSELLKYSSHQSSHENSKNKFPVSEIRKLLNQNNLNCTPPSVKKLFPNIQQFSHTSSLNLAQYAQQPDAQKTRIIFLNWEILSRIQQDLYRKNGRRFWMSILLRKKLTLSIVDFRKIGLVLNQLSGTLSVLYFLCTK